MAEYTYEGRKVSNRRLLVVWYMDIQWRLWEKHYGLQIRKIVIGSRELAVLIEEAVKMKYIS